MRRLARLLPCLLLVGAEAAPAGQGGAAPGTAAGAGPGPAALAAMRAAGCPLCHSHAALPAAPRVESCSGCHQWVRQVAASPAAREKALAVFPLWERYERSVATYLPVPDLGAAMARLDPAWVAAYLDDPHDLRPGLPETMPRFQLDAAQRDAIASAFGVAAVPATPAPDPARVAAGERLFDEKGCAGCHAFGGRRTGGIPAAPDLAHARDRLDADVAAAWIRDPRALSPSATMPSLGLGPDEVLALRDFLWLADPQARAPAAPTPMPAATRAPVSWSQVEERVFGRICVHCHMDPAQNQGRRGPGNAGGFGWAETGIELQTREGVCAQEGPVLAALERRREEARRDHLAPGEAPAAIARPALPGMPLGLPPIPDADLALVAGWFAQGCPP